MYVLSAMLNKLHLEFRRNPKLKSNVTENDVITKMFHSYFAFLAYLCEYMRSLLTFCLVYTYYHQRNEVNSNTSPCQTKKKPIKKKSIL